MHDVIVGIALICRFCACRDFTFVLSPTSFSCWQILSTLQERFFGLQKDFVRGAFKRLRIKNIFQQPKYTVKKSQPTNIILKYTQYEGEHSYNINICQQELEIHSWIYKDILNLNFHNNNNNIWPSIFQRRC